MKRSQAPSRAGLLLFLAFFLGLAVNALVLADVVWFHVVLRAPAEEKVAHNRRLGDEAAGAIGGPTVERLRQGILHIRVPQCAGGGENGGTAFVVKPGYVATAAHVLGDQPTCAGPIRLVDSRGIEHPARLEGYSQANDLALLRIADTALPPLDLADSKAYETTSQVVRLVTIGYPLEGVASSADRAAISGEGNISQYDRGRNLFITSGLNLNPGNSGGPIFIRDTWKVLGVAVAKLDVMRGEGIALVAPIAAFEDFFREKTGEELR
jgi:S1-C subfamily serine protease